MDESISSQESIGEDSFPTDPSLVNFYSQSSEPEQPRENEALDLVEVSQHTKIALQVFSLETHPSVYKQGYPGKEGLSMFALFNRCVSSIGRAELRRTFDQPTHNVEELNHRLDMVQFFMTRPEVRAELKNYLKNIHEPGKILEKVKVADLSVSDWWKLTKTLESTISIFKILQRVPRKTFNLADEFVSTAKLDEFLMTLKSIHQVIDFADSNKRGTFQINQGLNPDLDGLKKILDDLPNLLAAESKKELVKYRSHIEECFMDYEPLLGFHLQVRLSPERLVTGNYRIPGLEYKFLRDDICYYKSPSAYNMDNHIGDIYTDICNMQRMYQTQLQAKIATHVKALKELANFCGKLDW